LKIYNLSNLTKKVILLISDILIISFSIVAAFSLRLEKIYPIWSIDYRIFFVFFIVFISIFYFFNIYQILLRFFDNFSIIKIIKAVLLCQSILIIINFSTYNLFYFPRSISFIAPVLIGILVIIHRIILNYLIQTNKKDSKSFNNILIYGINDNTVSLLKNLRQTPSYGAVKGFIDLYGRYKKRELNGIKIYKDNNLNEIIENNFISEIIIGSKNFSKTKLKYLFDKLEHKNIRIINLSETNNYLKSFINKSLESKSNFFDIIDRPKIKVDNKILIKKIKNKNILVTGGGGSIGGELCLEILKHRPKKLYILELSEINLFNIINKIKLNFKYNKNTVKPILGDCTDRQFLMNHFGNLKIDDIYHASAYKHVGFGEENPYSIIKNNIFGTKNILEFAVLKKIKDFIFISSDKAVNPKSMLGFTKKFGEVMVNECSTINKRKIKTNFTIVRFGNVIGSSGSVIPTFISQIEKKTSLTVTNKNAKRYFMSILEAVQLVINSSFLNKKGIKIFALDMGEQIKIYDIAKRIIRLSGRTIKNTKNPKGDIPIKIIGLKKGEKISEEITLGKNLKKTNNPKIMMCDEKLNKFDINYNMNRIQEILDSKNINLKLLKKYLKV